MSSKSCVHLGLPDRGSPLSSTVEFWVFTPLTTALPDNRCINKSDSYRQDFKSDRCQSHLCRTKLVWKSTFSTRRHSDLPAAARNLTSPAPLWISPHLPHSGRNLTSPAPLWISPYLPHSGLKVPPLVSFFLLWHKTQNPVLWVKCCPVYERLSPWDPHKVQTKNEKHVRMDAYSPSSRLF